MAALDLAREPAERAGLDSDDAWAMVDSGDPRASAPARPRGHGGYDELGDAVAAGLAAAALGYALARAGDNAGAVEVLDPRWDAIEDLPEAEPAQLALGKALVVGSLTIR